MLTVVNSTFTGNFVTQGGGGLFNGDTLTLTNCTVSGNVASDDGGGIFTGAKYGAGYVGDLTLNNTIVAGNTSATTSDDDIYGQVQPTSAFNLIGDGSEISNLTDLEEPALRNLIGTTADPLDPLLGPPADNGGPTQTMVLLPGSPAIDAGSNALAVDANGNPLTTNQRGAGFPRILGHSVDIGAYEFSPLSQTISFGPLAGQTYGVAPITLNATDTSGLTVSYMVVSGPATISDNLPTITGAGNVVIAASQPGNATYSAAVPVDESFTVAPASLTITPTAGQSMVSGGTVSALTYTYTGLVNGDPSATFSGGLATTATSSSSVGGYPITVGTLAATGNYTIGTFNAGMLTVNAAPLTITPTADQSMVYGAAVPALTYTASGFVNGDPASLLTGALGTTATSTSAVGNYPFTLGSLTAGANYTLALAANPPTFAVTPATLTVTANAETKVYGSSDPALTYTASVFQLSDTAASVLTGALTRTAGETVAGSPYAISQGTLAADANYTIAFTGNTLTITPATLTVTAAKQSEIYGALLPSLTYSYSGLENGDTSSVFSGALSTTATASSKVGTYPINQGNLSAGSNYVISFSGSTLSITPATPTITWANPSAITYGTALSAMQLDATASWTVGGNTVNVPGSFTYNPAAGTVLSAGNNQTLSVSFTPTDTSDYTNATDTASINVAQYATTTILTASAPPCAPGQSVTFTASVAGGRPSPYLPTGSVKFQVNSVTVGSSVPLTANDTAAFSTVEPASGSFIVTAVYSGDANFTASTSPAYTESVLSPGVYAVGSTLYVVGANSNDYALIRPSGSTLDGSTGLAVVATLNSVSIAKAFSQTFTVIDIFGYGGNDNFQLSSTLTLPTTVVEGNGNNYLLLAGGNDSVTLGSGSNQVFGGNGNKTITAQDAACRTDSIQLGNGNKTVTLGAGNDHVVLGSGNNTVTAGNGKDSVTATGNGNNTITLGNGSDYINTGNGTDVISLGSGNENIQVGNGQKTIMAGGGNDYVHVGSGNVSVTLLGGNDNVQLGAGDDTVSLGNGNDCVAVGDGNDNVTVGNGNVQLGNGSDVIVEGIGNNYVLAGNGADLVVGGRGQHTIQLGNGNDILIDGSATVVNCGDSLRQFLSDWNASSLASVNKCLKVVYNTSHPNVLKAGIGRDWFFFTYSKDVTNKKATDRLN